MFKAKVIRVVNTNTAPVVFVHTGYRRPVVVEGQFFESITDAAQFLVRQKYADERYVARLGHSLIQREHKRITRMCNQDCWEGYYWAE